MFATAVLTSVRLWTYFQTSRPLVMTAATPEMAALSACVRPL